MKTINKISMLLGRVGLIFAVIFLLFVFGCDLAKPQKPSSSYQNPEIPTTEENNVQSAKKEEDIVQKETVQNEPAQKEAVDTSIKLDQIFEDKEYGFRFNYPGALLLEQGEGIIGMGKLTLWFSKQKLDHEMIVMRVTWMIDEQLLSKTKTQIIQDIKKEGGSLKLFEKIKLDNQDCIHFKVTFGGMFDPRGNRVSEQYFLAVKRGDLIINFSAPADKFETYRPQFIAILNTFKIDN